MYEQSLYPFSDQYGAKTIPLGVAHTFMTSWVAVASSDLNAAVATLRWIAAENRQLGKN